MSDYGRPPVHPSSPADRCPSVANVVARVDGGLARVKVPAGRLAVTALRAVAGAATARAGGVIEITGRANLQLRGVHDPAGLAADVAAADLTAGELGDLRRGVVAPPLAGLDPTALDDPTPLIAPLLAALGAAPELDRLSPKWGVTLDAGGAWPLAGRRDDVVVEARGGGRWAVRTAAADRVVGAAEVPAAVVGAAVAGVDRPRTTVTVRGAGRATGPLGAGPGRGTLRRWWGATPWLGRLTAATAAALADAAEAAGAAEVRLTPWRGVVVATSAPLAVDGLVDDPADPAAGAVACVGAAGCTSGLADAPADAAAVVAALRRRGGPPVPFHVSGCPKGCAGGTAVARTFVAVAPGRYDVLDGTGTVVARAVPPAGLEAALP
ncbi:MAG TPA: hypothetical protein VFP61_12810 [Acidimicrobiales bacterium]|nr:hypothetical protein [Acidimicrobiales bacterium]